MGRLFIPPDIKISLRPYDKRLSFFHRVSAGRRVTKDELADVVSGDSGKRLAGSSMDLEPRFHDKHLGFLKTDQAEGVLHDKNAVSAGPGHIFIYDRDGTLLCRVCAFCHVYIADVCGSLVRCKFCTNISVPDI